ncbi:hypothetical protein [Methylobacillus flagellatus]|uniref:Uncharacterized protein n=1 Tax=Methylobacillus flagellatus (strain ATCC 51484 / DSM 6875 / VKM B-1610 / KT) TaxID=265072 RepID=Q1GY57_METFK|nr:hypothetical protein [Methylobacillus flagellatus]ABE50830.1 hypothetical protein Mfla_2565 [Methylobacillus flagellatus KT]
MPIQDIQVINKRDQRITLDNGATLSISVEQIFKVNFYLDDAIVGYLRFESLSSLNNLEIRPVYKLREESFEHPVLAPEADALRSAAIALFQAYTNGKIMMGKENQAVH